jgi:hypothetical protein
MRRKAIGALMVFTLAFAATTGVSSAENDAAAPEAGVITGTSHMAIQGTAWVAERPGKFRNWKHWGWGTATRAKEATQEWVHIAVPTPTRIDGDYMWVRRVEFCAIAAKPLKSAPVQVDIWANNVRKIQVPIVWPDTDTQHCVPIVFDPAVWMESVGVSVLVKYANRFNKVTLTKAWVDVEPAPAP